jgi:hypothetical protein
MCASGFSPSCSGSAVKRDFICTGFRSGALHPFDGPLESEIETALGLVGDRPVQLPASASFDIEACFAVCFRCGVRAGAGAFHRPILKPFLATTNACPVLSFFRDGTQAGGTRAEAFAASAGAGYLPTFSPPRHPGERGRPESQFDSPRN